MLLFAPLVFGGNRPFPILIIHLLSVLILILLLWQQASRQWFAQAPMIFLLLLFGISLLYLLPLPLSLWQMGEARSHFSDILQLLDGDQYWRALSLNPEAGMTASLMLLSVIAVFAGSFRLSYQQQQTVVIAVFLLAVTEAVLAMLQVAFGSDSWLRFDNPYKTVVAVGSYANRNHLAGFFEMFLPLFVLFGVRRLMMHSVNPSDQNRLSFSYFIHTNKTLWAFGLSLILISCLLTRSRTGIALCLVGVLVAVLLIVGHFYRPYLKRSLIGFLLVILLVAMLSIYIGVVPMLERFFGTEHLNDLRWTLFQDSWRAAQAYWPLGSGFGTFYEAFPQFQSVPYGREVYHAHNDYLQALVEGGLFSVMFMSVYLLLLFRQAWYLLRKQAGVSERSFQWMALLGIVLMLVHSYFDFNLHIPANLLFFAVLHAFYFSRTGVKF